MKVNKFYKLIGQTINGLKVIDVTYRMRNKGRKAMALILCPFCQGEKWVYAPTLEVGKTKSCGCNRKCRPRGLDNKKTENLIGKRFGMLTVIGIDAQQNRRVKWHCECDCGNFKNIPAIYLKSGESSSCGCKTKRSGKENPLWSGHEEISGRVWASVKHSAVKRKIIFDLSIKDAWNTFLKQERLCALTKIPLVMGENASLDRIDSSKGYTIDNIQWLHKWVNIMKWDFTQKEFCDICKLVAKYN